ncbi:peptidyl-prolyl cis-trans isomerase, cyclophilin-type [Microscilla marina ATCC 23134]|uniref:peptidylprolyl isomerase n=2 Tax=Microscilla marina TaxID=1027 RepID=A1ZK63_MICM2|nr:peptidyl-prolyl cis-trans isomerase, cyclophilin-type [Microscilla marina ATCC 23134]
MSLIYFKFVESYHFVILQKPESKKMNHLFTPPVLWAMLLVTLLCSCGKSEKKTTNTSYSAYDEELEVAGKKKEKKKKKKKGKTFNLPSITLTQKNVEEELKKYGAAHPESVVMIYTRMGNLKLKLYKETPLHRANFIRLTKIKYFDRTQFHRVVKDFMIQGGGGGGLHRIKLKGIIGSYRIPHEIKPNRFFHKRGALATARMYENNPMKRSNPYNFYIVQGTKYNVPTLNNMAQKEKLNFNQAQMQAYTNIGGVPSLDGKHTVFGELLKGFDVLDKIAAVKTKKSEWPAEDIIIDSVRVVE